MDRHTGYRWQRWLLPSLGLSALGLLWLANNVATAPPSAKPVEPIILTSAAAPVEDPVNSAGIAVQTTVPQPPSMLVLPGATRCLPVMESTPITVPSESSATVSKATVPQAAQASASAATESMAGGPQLSPATRPSTSDDEPSDAWPEPQPEKHPAVVAAPAATAAKAPAEVTPSVPGEIPAATAKEVSSSASSAVATASPKASSPAPSQITLTPPTEVAAPAEPPSAPAADLSGDAAKYTQWGGALIGGAGKAWRTPQLEAMAQEADQHSQHACELAGRGASFAARAEFIVALRLVAQGLDSEQQTSTHSRALAAALVALQEAEDFIPSGNHLEADLDLAAIVRGHRTPVLHDAKAITPVEAIKVYLTYCQEQLAAAAGREMAGSIALQGLGKLHDRLAASSSAAVKAPDAKAMVFYQAALLVAPRNYLAANDLGVLLARCGHYAEARAALEHSVSLRPQPAGWHNLAVVYRNLGEADRAGRAEILAAAGGGTPDAAAASVQWVDPQTFSDLPAGSQDMSQPAASTAMAPARGLNSVR